MFIISAAMAIAPDMARIRGVTGTVPRPVGAMAHVMQAAVMPPMGRGGRAATGIRGRGPDRQRRSQYQQQKEAEEERTFHKAAPVHSKQSNRIVQRSGSPPSDFVERGRTYFIEPAMVCALWQLVAAQVGRHVQLPVFFHLGGCCRYSLTSRRVLRT